MKRVRLDVNIITKQSDQRAKFELFQRLNTGGTPLSDQEVRNCLWIMLDRDQWAWFADLANYEPFRACIALSDRNVDEQYDFELVLRFLVFRTLPIDQLRNISDLGAFLTDRMMEYAERGLDQETEEIAFKRTFAILEKSLGDSAFRRYDSNGDRFLGGFLVSAYEAIALGIGYNVLGGNLSEDFAMAQAKAVWSTDPFQAGKGSGRKASSRLQQTVPLGREMFANEDPN